MKTATKIVLVIAAIALLVVGEILFIKQIKEQTKEEVIESLYKQNVTDTVLVTDTIIKLHTKVRHITNYDTVVQIQRDSFIEEIPVQIPIEHKEYVDTFDTDSGTFNVNILYSGYKSNIDGLKLGYATKVTPRTIYKKGWAQFIGIGISAGYGACFSNSYVSFQPNVSLVVTYGFGYTFK